MDLMEIVVEDSDAGVAEGLEVEEAEEGLEVVEVVEGLEVAEAEDSAEGVVEDSAGVEEEEGAEAFLGNIK